MNRKTFARLAGFSALLYAAATASERSDAAAPTESGGRRGAKLRRVLAGTGVAAAGRLRRLDAPETVAHRHPLF